MVPIQTTIQEKNIFNEHEMKIISTINYNWYAITPLCLNEGQMHWCMERESRVLQQYDIPSMSEFTT